MKKANPSGGTIAKLTIPFFNSQADRELLARIHTARAEEGYGYKEIHHFIKILIRRSL